MGQRDGRDVGEHEEDLDFTLSTGTTEIGQSKCNLVYQPSSLPPSPEATADATTLRDLQRARVLAAAPPRPEEKAADPADPSPAGSGRATGTPGTKARGVCFTAPRGPRPDPAGRAGERGKALTLPCRAALSRLVVLPLRGRSGMRVLREAADLPRQLLWGGCWVGAVPRLPSLCAPRAPAPPLRAAAGAPVRDRLQSAWRLRSAWLRREAPGHSPLPGRRRGWPRGGGGDLAAWDSPLSAPAGPGATASLPTHLRLPGAGCIAPPGEGGRQPPHLGNPKWDRNGKERRGGRPSPHGRHRPFTFFTPGLTNIKREI